jgi:hypothetical protein
MNFWFFNSHHKSKVLTVKAQRNVIGLHKFMVNGVFQIIQCQTNQLWLYLELNVILHYVLQLVSSSRGYVKWKRSIKHKLTSAMLSLKELVSCSKEYRNNFHSPSFIVLYFKWTPCACTHATSHHTVECSHWMCYILFLDASNILAFAVFLTCELPLLYTKFQAIPQDEI